MHTFDSILTSYFLDLLLFLFTVALGKNEDGLQAAIAASTPGGVSSPSFSMGWSPYLWPTSIADLSMLSKFIMVSYVCVTMV